MLAPLRDHCSKEEATEKKVAVTGSDRDKKREDEGKTYICSTKKSNNPKNESELITSLFSNFSKTKSFVTGLTESNTLNWRFADLCSGFSFGFWTFLSTIL